MPANYDSLIEEEGANTRTSHWRLVLAGAVFLAVFFLMRNAEHQQRVVAAVFAAAVTLWMTEALPLAATALLSTVALVALGGLPHKEAFGAYGDQIVLLFIGSFIIAKSMEESGLDRRLSFLLLSRKWATKSASSTLLSLGVIACVISLFVSNTATTAMLLPIGVTILRAIGVQKRGHPVSTSYLLMLTWGSSIAVGTIIGTPPNVIGVGLIREATGTTITFLDWAMFAMPITVLMLLFAWVHLRSWRNVEPPSTAAAQEIAQRELSSMGPLTDAQRNTMIAFFTALALWLLPGIVEYSAGPTTELAQEFKSRAPEAVAALAGALLLFILPCRGVPSGRAMTWASAKRIEWGTILLFAGGLALGKATFDSGLAQSVGDWVATTTGANDVWMITAITTAMAIILSELASNTASATTMVPISIAIALGAGVNPIAPALGATIGSNLGFMLPISTPPNAIVYSSGLIPPGVMLRAGLIFDVVGFGVTMLCLRLILPPMGLA